MLNYIPRKLVDLSVEHSNIDLNRNIPLVSIALLTTSPNFYYPPPIVLFESNVKLIADLQSTRFGFDKLTDGLGRW